MTLHTNLTWHYPEPDLPIQELECHIYDRLCLAAYNYLCHVYLFSIASERSRIDLGGFGWGDIYHIPWNVLREYEILMFGSKI